MNQINSKKILDGIKKGVKGRIIAILCFGIVTALFIALGYFESHKSLGTPLDLATTINEQKERENQYAYIDASSRAFIFAEKDSNKLYFVWDVNNYLYILDLPAKTVKDLEKASPENVIRLTGTTKNIISDIKTIAIDVYNEDLSDEATPLTDDNFSGIFGRVYLYVRADLTNAPVFYTLAVIVGITALIIYIVHIVTGLKIKKAINKLSPSELNKIEFELEHAKTVSFLKQNIYLTEHYIVVLSNGLTIIKYDDIAWIYHIEMRQNGVPTSRSINIQTNDSKKHVFNAGVPYGKQKDEYLDIINNITMKNKNILVGFTNENKKIIKEKFKDRSIKKD